MTHPQTSPDFRLARDFIASVPWRQVQTKPAGPLHKAPDPHEYVILGRDHEQGRWFVGLIRTHGRKGRYTAPYNGKVMVNRYLVVDQFVYWWIGPRMLNRTRLEFHQHTWIDEPEQMSLTEPAS